MATPPAQRTAAVGRLTSPAVVAAFVMLFWGATPVATRLATRHIGTLDVAVLRTVIAGAVALPLIGLLRSALPTDRSGRLLLLASAVSGFVLFPLLYTVGQERTSAMHGGMILAALPIFTGTYGMLIERRRPRPAWLTGCGLALVGEAAIIAFRAGNGGAPSSLGGDLLVLVSALIVSFGYVAGARLAARGYASLSTTLWGVAIAALLMLPILLVSVAVDGVPRGAPVSWLAILHLAVVTSILGYIVWYWALARGGIARIAPIQFLQPFSGLVLAALLLGERFTVSLLGAAAAILVGISIAQRG